MTEETQIPAKKPRKPITEKQKKARQENLALGRARRMANIEKKKSGADVDDIESGSSSEEDNFDFVLSKQSKKVKEKSHKKPHKEKDNQLREDVEQLKTLTSQMIAELKKKKEKKQKPRTTNINVNVPAPAPAQQKLTNTDQVLNALRNLK